MEGGVVEDDPWREGSELVCFESSGRGALYRLIEVLWVVMVADGEVGVMGDQGHGRGHGSAQEVRASVTSVLAQ